jgi:hypothetical protein
MRINFSSLCKLQLKVALNRPQNATFRRNLSSDANEDMLPIWSSEISIGQVPKMITLVPLSGVAGWYVFINRGIFWWALEWKMLVYFSAFWYIGYK